MYFEEIKKKCHYIYYRVDNSQCFLLIKDPNFHLVSLILDLKDFITITLVNVFFSGHSHTLSWFCLSKKDYFGQNTLSGILKGSTQIYFQIFIRLLLLDDSFACYRILYWKIFPSAFWRYHNGLHGMLAAIKYSSVCDVSCLLATLSLSSFSLFLTNKTVMYLLYFHDIYSICGLSNFIPWPQLHWYLTKPLHI